MNTQFQEQADSQEPSQYSASQRIAKIVLEADGLEAAGTGKGGAYLLKTATVAQIADIAIQDEGAYFELLGALKAKYKVITLLCAAVKREIKERRKAKTLLPGEAWQRMLMSNQYGYKPNLANVLTALRLAPDWNGVLGYDEFARQTKALKSPPWTKGDPTWESAYWDDADDILATEWMQRCEIDVADTIVGKAIETVAKEYSFHPIRDYLNGLKWDGVSRLDTLLIRGFGAEDTLYTRAVSAKWAISAIIRILQPGSKVDTVLTLQGEQGIGKGKGLCALAGDAWFTDDMRDIDGKDAQQKLQGAWVIELGEMSAMNARGATSESTKSFLTVRKDRFRPAYGRRVKTIERECVFVGTTNQREFLRDETGARRFWPVLCQRVDEEWIKENRDQLWAEAVERLRRGERHWIEDAALMAHAKAEQADRYEADPWDEIVGRYLDGRQGSETDEVVTVQDILADAFEMKVAHMDQRAKNRVVRALKVAGWKPERASLAGRTTRYYVPGADVAAAREKANLGDSRVKLVSMAHDFFKDGEKAALWIKTAQPDLDGRSPDELIEQGNRFTRSPALVCLQKMLNGE
jgi:predicted P-loop ATPase